MKIFYRPGHINLQKNHIGAAQPRRDKMAEAPDSKNILAGAKYSPQQNGSGNETTAPAPQASEILLRGSQYNAEDLHPLARVHKGELDYLLLDEAALNEMEGARSVLPSRGWSDELCYGTGTMYLSGMQNAY